jgi:L-lactate dehydrogenase complex protein LldG
MTEKEKILGRIREALSVPAPTSGSHHHDEGRRDVRAAPPAAMRESNSYPSSLASAWLPLVGETFDARLALFQKNSTDLKSAFQVVNNRDQLAKSLCNLRDTENWKKVGVHSGELTNEIVRVLGLPVCRTDVAYNVTDLESCDVGITECEALVAQTGSVLVTAHSAGGRALSVLPPHHVVLARCEQLIADLPDAFALLKKKYGTNYPSFISFITGPSRTGDIERILVLGAHGPKKLTIFLL